MSRTDWLLSMVLLMAGLIVMVEVIRRPDSPLEAKVSANSERFDHVTVISPMYLYQGAQGVLLMDRRNGNIWFIAKGNEVNLTFRDPVFVARLPLEKLDQAPR